MTRPSLEDVLALAGDAEAASSCPGSPDHGVAHWRGVAEQGIWLARTLGLGREIQLAAFVFGAVHDCRRENEGHDPEHGPRAAAWLLASGWIGRLGLDSLEEDIVRSLTLHDQGITCADGSPAVGIGWDADRSLLSRVGVDPHPRFFSLAQGVVFNALVGRARWMILDPEDWDVLARKALA